jgi:signal transduction histidine kinase
MLICIPRTSRRGIRQWAVLATVSAVLVARGAAAVTEPPSAALASIAAVRQLTVADLDRGQRAMVRGTVTLSGSYAVIQEGEAALEVDATAIRAPDGRLLGDAAAPQDWPPLGAVVEVEGHVGSNGCAPQVRADTLVVIGQAPLPPALPVDLNALFDSRRIFQRVEVEGVVQGVEYWKNTPTTVYLGAGGLRLPVRVGREAVPAELERFVDAKVKIVAVMLALKNARGEFLAPWLATSGTEAIEVLAPPCQDPFDAPEVPLDAIARYRPTLSDGHRVRCRGTVTYATADVVYLQHGDRGVRLGLAPGTGSWRPAVGDVVEAAGFVDMSRLIGGLFFAVCRRVGGGEPPEPVRLGEPQLLAPHGHFRATQWPTSMGLYDGRLIRCRAVVAAPLPGSARGLAVTLGRHDGPRAELVFDEPLPLETERRLPRDTEIDVAGIVQIDLVASPLASIGRGLPMIGQVRLLVRRPEDVVVVRSPPWWTPRRLAVASGGLVASVVAAAVWVVFLRREVRRQMARAVAEESARKQAAAEHEAAIRERSLIAADLHDTLLQTLTGIGYQLHVCRNATDESPDHLAVAARLVDHASSQLRSTVWSLRAMPGARQPFADSVARLVELLTAGHPVAVTFRATGSAGPIHDLVARELLLVVQEAVSNAVHHGAPRRLEVSVAVDPAAVELIIRDDGCGFDDAARPGTAEGHFGIVGMRERIARLGGTIDIATAPGRGTTVTVRTSDPFEPPASRRDRFALEEEAVR